MTPLDLPLLGLVMLFRIFVVEPYTIPSTSMTPTLKLGDYFLVSKSAYGFNQFSFPIGQYLPAFEIDKSLPKRGDVVLFRLPSDPSSVWVKRVIGLAGDRVQVRGGVVYVNGNALKRERMGEYDLKAEHSETAVTSLYRETLSSGKNYDIIELTDNADGDNTKIFLVPPGHCFVMGDNRDNSADSRFTVGYLPYANIFAKALVTVDYGGKALTAHAIK